MLDQLNIEAIEFSVSADTKMLLLLCGKSLGRPKHNCPFCDATEPFHGDHNLYTIGDLFDWHEKYVKDGAKRNVHSGEKQAGEADLEGNQARDFLKCLDTFICPLCNHPSNTTTNLNNHIKKVHKITLCQAERLAKKTRFGQNMTDDDLEHNKTMLERGKKILDSKKLRPENQKGEEDIAASDQQQDLSLLRKIKEQPRETVPGPSQDSQDSREQEPRF